MNNFLEDVVAKDLGIRQFEAEDNDSFLNRVVYSALSCWLKAICLDQNDQCCGVTLQHLLHRGHTILEEYLLCYPKLSTFLNNRKTTECVNILIKRLLRNQDLLPIGFNSNLGLAPSLTIRLNNDLECIKGSLLQDNCYYSGLAYLRFSPTSESIFTTPMSVDSWLNTLIAAQKWRNSSAKFDDFEFFNPSNSNRNNYQAWTDKFPEEQNFVLGRLPRNIFYKYEYFLFTQKGTKYIKISDELLQLKEHRRFMFGCRALEKKQLPILITKSSNFVRIKLTYKLPEQESRLLEVFSWPDKIDDQFNYVMPIKTWHYIEPYLLALGLRPEIRN